MQWVEGIAVMKSVGDKRRRPKLTSSGVLVNLSGRIYWDVVDWLKEVTGHGRHWSVGGCCHVHPRAAVGNEMSQCELMLETRLATGLTDGQVVQRGSEMTPWAVEPRK